MKRVLIHYEFMMKDLIPGKGQLYASLVNENDEDGALVEAKRGFYDDNGFLACFDVLEIKVTSVAVAD